MADTKYAASFVAGWIGGAICTVVTLIVFNLVFAG